MIGIFDSGVGGFTVAKEVFKYLPDYQTIYFGDTARLPYGTKGADFVKKYSDKITGWLIGQGAQIIVVACHSASATSADYLKRKYKDTPIFDMTSFLKEDILNLPLHKKIGVIGTPGTIKSGSYEKKLTKLNSGLKIFSKSCPLFVPLVEEGWTDNKIAIEVAKTYLTPLEEKGVDVLVLGCTHYPLLEKTIKSIMGKVVSIVNPAESVAKKIREFLQNNPKIEAKIKKGKKHKFFFSDEPYNLEKISRLCFGKKIKAKIDDPF